MADSDEPLIYEGMDRDWFAVDDDGLIGHLTSGGSRVIAPSAVASRNRWDRLYTFMESLPFKSKEVPAPKRRSGDLDSWRDMARKGLYSYEFVSEDTAAWERGRYELVFSPAPALRAADLPAEIRELLTATRMAGVKFSRDHVLPKDLILKT